MIIISIWSIVGIILCLWFILTDRKYFNIPWCILICILLYTFSPIIILAAIIYFVLYLTGFIDRR